jgi:hypothetical protein
LNKTIVVTRAIHIQRRGRPGQVNEETEVEFSSEASVTIDQEAEDSTVEGSD